MNVENFDIGKLHPYRRTLRKNDHAVERTIDSIRQFGFKIPILARGNGEIVDGHLRWKAALKMQLKEVPVILCDEWSEDQVRAFRLMVNRSATWAAWDLELVALELKDLHISGFDLNLTGFTRFEINKALFGDDPNDGVAVNGVAPHKVSRSGDLWICERHHVLCGDATSPDDVRKLIAEMKPDLMVTDPPYGVEYEPLWREEAGLGQQRQTGTVRNDDRVDWSEAYKLFPGNVAYVWHAGVHLACVASNLEACGFRIRAQIIWAKQHFALGRGDYHWQHEPCLYAVREGKSSNWHGDRAQSTLWQVANLNPFGNQEPEEATGHGTQKPIEIFRRPILNNSEVGDAVYDPFLGSGTTLIAAEFTKRVCYGLEIDPGYVDLLVRRWQKFTQKDAFLESNGKTFTQMAEEREALAEVR